MPNENISNVAIEMDRLVLESRLQDIALIAQTDRKDRLLSIATVLSKLKPGAYLLGCGPYACGILPITVDEIVLGRPPSPLESLPDSLPDYTLNDAVWLAPREASRIHASIQRHGADGESRYWIRDDDSRAGTYVNLRRIGIDDDGHATGEPKELANGDIISLGPSGVNSYVFFVVPE